jgi:hypothetical protein
MLSEHESAAAAAAADTLSMANTVTAAECVCW